MRRSRRAARDTLVNLHPAQLGALVIGIAKRPNTVHPEASTMMNFQQSQSASQITSRMIRTALAAALAVGLFAAPTSVEATTINISSLETVLAEPDNKTSTGYAAWTGWMTQVYEYNMPFVELANAVTDKAVSVFRMSIGDTNYRFSNLFSNKAMTNSWNIPVNGEYALLGTTTPGIDFSTTIEDDGDTLVIDFGPNGLQPGETVRFQVDIDADPGSQGTMMYAPYSSVFFQNGGTDTSNNSVVSVEYIPTGETASATLPNFDVPNAVSLTTPRPYAVMQMVDVQPDFNIGDPIPEPGAVLIAALASVAMATRSRRSVA